MANYSKIFLAILGVAIVVAPVSASARYERSTWILRGGVIAAVPAGDMEFSHDGKEIPPMTKESNPTGIGGEGRLAYFISDNVSFEGAISFISGYEAGVPVQVDRQAGGPTIIRLSRQDVSVLPMDLNIQYHIAPYGQLTPYVGLGVGYAVFTEVYDSTFTMNLQAGIDWWANEEMGLSIGIKKYFGMAPDAAVFFDGEQYEVKQTLDPLILSASLAYRF